MRSASIYYLSALVCVAADAQISEVKTVFIIVMENHRWSEIKGSASAPFINNTLLPISSYATNYNNPPGNHPSLSNYLWLEAGTNFGVVDDADPATHHQSTTSHLATQLTAAGIAWKSYQEDISGNTCPLTSIARYAPKHNPFVYFDDVTDTNNPTSPTCLAHVRPYSELAADLANKTIPRYVFITPNLCNDMHDSCAPIYDPIRQGDAWLSTEVPKVLSSAAYQNGGALFITWDESEAGDAPIGMLLLSPLGKGGGYNNTIYYTHGSLLRTVEEIFGVSLIRDAASQTDLGDLFKGPAAPLQFVPVNPCRVADTREGSVLGAGTTRNFVISNACGIPAQAAAFSLNVTAIPRMGALGFLTVWPAGQARPTVSTLNSPDGSVLANAALLPAGSGGAISAYATNDADLVLDINGYFIAPGIDTLQFYPLPPCRVVDTRGPSGTYGGPSIEGGTSRSFPISAAPCGAALSAAAYSVNVTAVPHGPLGFVTAWPSGQPRPLASTLNSIDGTILANAAIVPAGAGFGGPVSLYASDTTDVVVDIDGYFAPPGPGGLNFYTLPPCRVVDTRILGGPIIGGSKRELSVAGACGLSAGASAYSFNITAVPRGPLGFMTVWPPPGGRPVVSTLNGPKGLVTANAALVPAGASPAGSVDVYVTDASDVVIDVNGYFRP